MKWNCDKKNIQINVRQRIERSVVDTDKRNVFYETRLSVRDSRDVGVN